MVKTIKLDRIVSEDNRKYTKDEGFEQLVSSISRHGIIEQPVVRALASGKFKVIAGRRRIAALRKLGIEETECTVYGAGDQVSDEEVAAAENVNRLEMHPLDEAALFRSMADKGASVEGIARHYARSQSAIYKRLRLSGLEEELKGMFRDGKLNIAGAAVLAELPEKDQKDFYEAYKEKEEIENAVINQFVYRKQKRSIRKNMKGCEGCAKRTHNEDNDLFEEFENMTDVCLDGDCYRLKWYEIIRSALEAQIIQMNDGGIKTDDKIFFRGGAPEELYKKANRARFKIEKTDIDFEILYDKDYDCTGETNRKKDACWLIHTAYDGEIDVRRVGYKARPPREKPETLSAAGKGDGGAKSVKEYGKEILEAAAAEQGMKPAEVATALDKKNINKWNLESRIKEIVYDKVTASRIELEKEITDPLVDYLSIFLKCADKEFYGDGNTFDEKSFNERQKKWHQDLLGGKPFKQIYPGLDDEAKKLFHFLLLLSGYLESEVVSLEDLRDIKEDNPFLSYASMSKDEYKALYLEASKEAITRALAPKGKKKPADVKKKSAKTKKEETPDEDEEEDNYPFEPDGDIEADEGEE